MRQLIVLTLVLAGGCIFGGGSPQDGEDAGLSDDMTAADGSRPDDGRPDLGESADLGEPSLDFDRPDASPNDMTQPPDDVGSPDDWHLPDYAKRMLVSWNRSGIPVPNFVVPIEIPGADGQNLNAAAVWPTGIELPGEQDARTLWVRVPDFGRTGELWVYFDGPARLVEPRTVWGGYEGVWHFSLTGPGRDSTGLGNMMSGVGSVVPGLIGQSAPMPDGGGEGNIMTSPLGFAGQRSYTVEMWVTLGDSTQNNLNNRIFDDFYDGDSEVALRWSNGRRINMIVGIPNGSLTAFANYPEMTTHLGLVVDESRNTVELYVNGVPDISLTTPPGWNPSTQSTAFGSGWYGGGTIEEVRVSYSARPPEYFVAVATTYPRGDQGILQYGMVEQRP